MASKSMEMPGSLPSEDAEYHNSSESGRSVLFFGLGCATHLSEEDIEYLRELFARAMRVPEPIRKTAASRSRIYSFASELPPPQRFCKQRELEIVGRR
mmetsp:Transcript_88035/g.234074  ORF Transcript_88035/g.234074 Transcript_88035/m.234074 type:complete len:98 (-) Transcript_88035:241-534(-)